MKASKPADDASPELSELPRQVTAARAQLAEWETVYTREKSRVEAVQAGLFRRLRGHYQQRDRLRLAVEYRQKFLDSFIRDSTEEVEQAEMEFEQAKARLDADYEGLAAAADTRKELAPGQAAELAPLWAKLVTLFQPGRFAGEPDKIEAYHKLSAAINLARDEGDLETLRAIAEDPGGFVLRKGWSVLDFGDRDEPAQLPCLRETLLAEINAIVEGLNVLRTSPDFDLCQLAGKTPAMLEELAAERAKQLELEIAGLEKQAEELAAKIKEVSGAA